MLLPGGLPALRPVPASLLHLTLAFIGGLPADRLARVSAACQAAAAGSAPFDVALQGIGCFPSRGRPRVVWLGLADAGRELATLSARVREALRRGAVPFDDKPFRAHLTLARVRPGSPPGAVAGQVAALAALEPVAIRFRAEALHVVESILSPTGPRYALRETVLLGGRQRDG